MSEMKKLLKQNKNGDMVWYTHRWKEVVSKCEVFGFSKKEIIEKYGSIEEFEKVETEHYESVIETYNQYDWSGEGVECEYELSYETNWGDWEEKDDYECKDGFHIFDGVDRKWMSDEVTKDKVERNCSIYIGDWKQLGLDLGIVEDKD